MGKEAKLVCGFVGVCGIGMKDLLVHYHAAVAGVCGYVKGA